VNRYVVLDEAGTDVGVGILQTFYGTLWESVMDRLNHQDDGFMYTLHHNRQKFRVYRCLEIFEQEAAAVNF